ncbi:chromosome 9 open reading frame 172 [Nesidiocoris tenuis]|uniref:Chromosome 9 open reading frame 172 n=1 Tax=Nesidiocoris tenuis TaxID=355587 RepID=A0ABN7BDW1_9HEMI|nr:chromosome 9 open reading frame 172 [Nesidiocoris tenuis]
MDTEAPLEDMPSSDWSDKLEATTNHWLPAYGFQQPSQIQEALLSHDYLNTDGLGGTTSYVYLETITEETSDDLRSDSEYSEIAGWPDTDSEAGSVIHIPNVIGPSSCNSTGDWSGSERDLAVPKKRRRRLFPSHNDDVNDDPGVNDDDDDDDAHFLLPPLTSRSSSLLQFEQLEKQCDTVFRASASHEQFVHSSPSLTSSFSFDSLEISSRTLTQRFSNSIDSLDDESTLSSRCSSRSGGSSSELVSSDDEIARRSKSTNRQLTTHRSYDSLVSNVVDRQLTAELSVSCDGVETRLVENVEVSPPRGLYKTVECLTVSEYENNSKNGDGNEGKKSSKNGQRSVENLSEDSGFGEHIPKQSISGLSTIVAESEPVEEEPEWDENKSKFNPSWQSAPDLSGANRSDPADSAEGDQLSSEARPVSTTSLFAVPDDEIVVIENKPLLSTFKPAEMNTRVPVVSTPNLYAAEKPSAGQTIGADEFELNFPQKNDLSRVQSFKIASASNPNLARKTRSKGSNIQITTSFINLTDSKGSLNNGSSKWVHFSPVVSEVSWRDSDRDVDDVWSDDEFDLDETKVETERRSGGGRRPSGPPPQPPARAPAPADPPQRSSSTPNVVGTTIDAAPNISAPSVDPVNGDMETKKSGIGGFFRRFSLRRLSGKDKRKKEAKKENGKLPPPPTTTTAAEETTIIIPLHPPSEAVKPAAAPVKPTASDQRTRPPPPPPPRRTASAMSSGCRVAGLLETDLDSPAAAERPPHQQTSQQGNQHPPPKTRSLLDLGGPARAAKPCPAAEDVDSAENRAKSMEFLLDKDNHYAAKVSGN